MTSTERLVRVEWATLEGQRPWSLGKNARLPAHGNRISVPICRLTTSEGARGFGPGQPGIDLVYEALGLPLARLFSKESGTRPEWRAMDYALWDMASKQVGLPVHEVVRKWSSVTNGTEGVMAEARGVSAVPCYDTSLYFEDLEEEPNRLEVIVERAQASYERGHRAFKIKVGRGGRWMDPVEGLERDVAVVGAVREALGRESSLFADANNGFTFNGAREFLKRSSSANLAWLEEAFNEDSVLLRALREWMMEEGLGVAVADCESASPEDALQLASSGVLDIVQCDILRTSFTGWLALGSELDRLGVGSAPHHFGAFFGNFITGHLAGAVKGLRYVEWDEVRVPGLSAAGYDLSEGKVLLSDLSGFGIELDEDQFSWAVRTNGFDLAVTTNETS